MTNTYNTRRKSLSLEALGVQVPGVGRSHSHRASLDSKQDRPVQLPATTPRSQAQDTAETQSSPPAKRIKRSHSPPATCDQLRPSSAGSAQQKADKTTQPAAPTPTKQQKDESQKPPSRHVEYTPPPSPPAEDERKIDYESISDDIVEGVVRQLEKTGNRPHLIKELAAVLSTTHDAVTSSANAPALLSSRLANYMKRSCWNNSNACPVGKELIPIHPRKVFYYLTDRERQVLPDTSDDIYGPLGITSPTRITPPAATPSTAGASVMGPPSSIPSKRAFAPAMLGSVGYNVSPPLSNASIVEDEQDNSSMYERGRFAMSPSPEVDLSVPTDYEHGDEEQELNSQVLHSAVDDVKRDFPSPPADTSSQSSYTSARSNMTGISKSSTSTPSSLGTRHQTPPLEGVEHDFTATARQFRERGSGTNTPIEGAAASHKMDGVKEQEHSSGELFAQQPHKGYTMSSPAFQPQHESKHQAKASIDDVTMMDADFEIGEGLYRWDMTATSDISVDDLDSLLA